MIPIAEDRQNASKGPTHPSVRALVSFSLFLGLLQACFSIAFYMTMEFWMQGELTPYNTAAFGDTLVAVDGYYCNNYAQVIKSGFTCLSLQKQRCKLHLSLS
jgi:hypothetical protein